MSTGVDGAYRDDDGQAAKGIVLETGGIFAEGLVTVAQGAEFLGVSRSTLYQLMDAGDLWYVKIRRSRRIPKLALVAFAQQRCRGSGVGNGPHLT